MTCKKCNKTVVVESLGDGKSRVRCESCGLSEIQDSAGRKLLTSDLNRSFPKPLQG
jgi:ribosomal protein S27E